jgi:hypothetical protein
MTSRITDKEERLQHDTLTFRIDQDIVDELRQEIKAENGKPQHISKSNTQPLP